VKYNTQEHLLAARTQKEDRYGSESSDLNCTGLYLIFPCLGHFLSETLAQVAVACCALNRIIRSLFEQAAHGAIFCSYRILILDLPLSGQDLVDPFA